MPRSCGRPGCSEPGAVAYGLSPGLLLAWLAPLGADADPDTPVLCRRHADRTTVPKGWTLDDRRELTPRLFRPPPAIDTPRPGEKLATVLQLRPRTELENPRLPLDLPSVEVLPIVTSQIDDHALFDDRHLTDETVTTDEAGATGGVDTVADRLAAAAASSASETQIDDAAAHRSEDLDALLLANSPLLARAFHGRPRS